MCAATALVFLNVSTNIKQRNSQNNNIIIKKERLEVECSGIWTFLQMLESSQWIKQTPLRQRSGCYQKENIITEYRNQSGERGREKEREKGERDREREGSSGLNRVYNQSHKLMQTFF